MSSDHLLGVDDFERNVSNLPIEFAVRRRREQGCRNSTAQGATIYTQDRPCAMKGSFSFFPPFPIIGQCILHETKTAYCNSLNWKRPKSGPARFVNKQQR